MLFLKTPKFWYKKSNDLQKILLKPIAKIYSYISTRNYFKDYRYKSEKSKVIAIGGITAGGSGKTIVVQSICEILKSKGKKVAVLSRGFGRSSDETLLVDNKIHSYKDVGDEPLLLSNFAPVYVGKDRAKSAKLTEQEGFDFLILDDGITQKYLKPDLKIVVIDGEQRFGNGEMFPLGPNRLDFEKIKSDIDGVVILGSGNVVIQRSEATSGSSFINNKNDTLDDASDSEELIFFGELKQDFSQLKKKRIIAFCGIGYPDKFFNSLKDFDVIEKVAFPDHYPFSDKDIENLLSMSQKLDAQLVSTEKDLRRVPQKYRAKITTVPITIIWQTTIDSLLDRA